MHLHILGICGTFMGGLAAIAKQAGHTVTGCDANVYPPMSTQLGALGIGLTEGWDPRQLDTVAQTADLFLVGNVVTRGNPLVEALLDRGSPYTSGPQWLADNVLRDKHVLAVAGTHGKTTTSAALAWILQYAGLEPGFLIGGVPKNFPVSARLTDSRYFVIEADEYDTAFFDKRSKFVHYRPRTVILNNLEFDHADIFPDLAAIETQFHHLVRTVPASGLLVVNGEDQALPRVLARGCWSKAQTFGEGAHWQLGGGAKVLLDHVPRGRLEWSMPGRHNALNALAAVAAACHVGVEIEDSLTALKEFTGVKRRMEERGSVEGVTVYDDFAHHPTAIRETIAALRVRVNRGRVLAVIEPRSATMRLGTTKELLPRALAEADLVFCYADKLGWDPTEVLGGLGGRARVFQRLDELIEAICAQSRRGDHVLVMSNGGFGGIHQKLLEALPRREAVVK